MSKLEKILEDVKSLIDEKLEAEKSWDKSKDWVKYSGPHFSSDEYVAAVQTLLSGWLIFGEKSNQFENIFPKELGKKHGILTNSGSSANLLMVASLLARDPAMKKEFGIEKGDKFITPVVCFPTTINPLIQHGLVPVFVDVTLPSLNLDLDQVEKLLIEDSQKSKREIKGIIFAHVLGNPPDMDRLMSLVEKYDLVFLEDSCDALGSTYDGKLLGSFGDISTCSFFPAHHMTMGEGGFVATNSSRVKKVLSSIRDWGRACYCNSFKPGDVTCETACGNRFGNWLKVDGANYDHRYVFDEIGYNLKPLDLQAAMGLEQLKKLDYLHQRRKENFDKLMSVFEPYQDFFHLPKATEKSDPSWFGFLLTIKENAGFSRLDLVNHLERNRIQTRSYFTGNCLYHPAYAEIAKDYVDIKDQFPIAHKVTFDTMFLGTFAGITDDKISHIRETINEFFKNRK